MKQWWKEMKILKGQHVCVNFYIKTEENVYKNSENIYKKTNKELRIPNIVWWSVPVIESNIHWWWWDKSQIDVNIIWSSSCWKTLMLEYMFTEIKWIEIIGWITYEEVLQISSYLMILIESINMHRMTKINKKNDC